MRPMKVLSEREFLLVAISAPTAAVPATVSFEG